MRRAIMLAVLLVVTAVVPVAAQDGVVDDMEQFTLLQGVFSEILSDIVDDPQRAKERLADLELRFQDAWPDDECLEPFWGFQVAMIAATDRTIDYFMRGQAENDPEAFFQAAAISGYVGDAMGDEGLSALFLDCL